MTYLCGDDVSMYASGGCLFCEVVWCGPLEPLSLLNHLLMLCSLSRYCSRGGLLGTASVGHCLWYLFMGMTSSLCSNVCSYGCGVEARCGVDVGVALQTSGWVARSVFH